MLSKKGFQHRLNYTLSHEDWLTEEQALEIKPSDQVICITASGDRPLNLLNKECALIVSVDSNPLQNALLDLKMNALLHLAYEDYLGFLGIKPRCNRIEVYHCLSYFLQPSSIELLKPYHCLIAKGIIYGGKQEKILKRCALILQTLWKNPLQKLFETPTLQAQREWMQQYWSCKKLQKAFSYCLQPWICRYMIQNPLLYQQLPEGKAMSQWLYEKVYHALWNVPIKQMMLFSLGIQGKLYPEGLPPYLDQKCVRTISSHAHKIRMHTADILDFLKQTPDQTFDVFSFSDVIGYMTPTKYHELCVEMIRTAKPYARFCMRHMCHPTVLKTHENIQIQVDKGEYLAQKERGVSYHFTVGQIHKS